MQHIKQPTPAFAAERVGPVRAGEQDAFHAHPGFELDFAQAGGCLLRLDGFSLTLNAGDAVLLAPGCPHRFTAGEGKPAERILLHFDAAFLPPAVRPQLKALTAEGDFCRMAALSGRAQLYVREILERLLSLSAAGAAGEAEAGFLLAALLFYLREQRRECDGSCQKDAARMAWQAADYLNAHYAERLTLAGVAARFRRSQAYLSRLFHAVTGQTMVQYLNGVRVRAAQALLEAPDAPDMAETARRCGFGSTAHFSRTFHALTGLTPQQYRRARQKNTQTQ